MGNPIYQWLKLVESRRQELKRSWKLHSLTQRLTGKGAIHFSSAMTMTGI